MARINEQWATGTDRAKALTLADLERVGREPVSLVVPSGQAGAFAGLEGKCLAGHRVWVREVVESQYVADGQAFLVGTQRLIDGREYPFRIEFDQVAS